ncbi:hypothetical protein [Micromonospora chalcea]|uniref:hypothetical protein n=1 Tax=Micromonospora chalcea TaxID=1874 RepID=UPI003D72BA5B
MDLDISTPALVLVALLNFACTAALWLWTRATAARRHPGPWWRLWVLLANVATSGVITGVLISRIDLF